jgi:hypothetical protein
MVVRLTQKVRDRIKVKAPSWVFYLVPGSDIRFYLRTTMQEISSTVELDYERSR